MHRIVVLGGGYTGLAVTTSLAGRTRRRADVAITLVTASERFTERLRLHQVAAGEQLADLRLSALLAGTGVELEVGWVTAVDAAARTVRIDDERVLAYDTLVYALGATADTGDVPGAGDHAYTLDSDRDAGLLTRKLTAGGTLVVAGSGLTGVEAAAEIAERHPGLTVELVGRHEPGAELGPKARAHLLQALRARGVRTRRGAIIKVLPDGVTLAGGATVPADAVLWTTGVRVSSLTEGFAVDDRGRIVTDATLRSVSHPDVYAVGDAAAIRQPYGVMHGTCQSGIPTGVHAARTIVRRLDGKPGKPFRFGYVHTPVSLGRHDAVVQFTRPDHTPGRFFLTGRLATWYKETVSASPWPSFGQFRRRPAIGVLGWRRGGAYTR
jgi:NADH:ubiquinone reductase (H+-translocating)